MIYQISFLSVLFYYLYCQKQLQTQSQFALCQENQKKDTDLLTCFSNFLHELFKLLKNQQTYPDNQIQYIQKIQTIPIETLPIEIPQQKIQKVQQHTQQNPKKIKKRKRIDFNQEFIYAYSQQSLRSSNNSVQDVQEQETCKKIHMEENLTQDNSNEVEIKQNQQIDTIINDLDIQIQSLKQEIDKKRSDAFKESQHLHILNIEENICETREIIVEKEFDCFIKQSLQNM